MHNMQPFANIILPGENRRRQKFYLSKAKLSHVVQLSAFMGGFAVRSIVNLQVTEELKGVDEIIMTLYVVLTSLLVATTSFVILTAMWVLPLLKTSEQINSDIMNLLEAQHPAVLRSFNLQEFSSKLEKYSPGKPPIFGLKTYRTTSGTVRLVEVVWILAGTVSVFLFTADVITINWVKFRHLAFEGAVASTIVLVLVLVGLGIFGIYFRLYFVRKFRNITKKVDKEEISWLEYEHYGTYGTFQTSISNQLHEDSFFSNKITFDRISVVTV